MFAIDERWIAGCFDTDERTGAARRGVFVARTVAVVEAVLGALCIGQLAWGVWMHQWQGVPDGAAFRLFVMVSLPLLIGAGWFPWRTILAAVGRLWQAAAESNDALAPMAATQPEPLEDAHDAREVLTPLRGIRDNLRAGNYWKTCILFWILGLVLGGVSLILGHVVLEFTAEYGDDGWILLGVTLALALMPLAMLFYGIRWPILMWRLGRGLSVVSDETGLTWRDTRWNSGRRHIAWSEVEACITIMCESSESPTRVYAVKAGGTTLFWSVTTSMSPQEHAASDRLLRLVVTRTRLPLRDLTAIVRAATDEALLADAQMFESLVHGVASLVRGKRTVARVVHAPDTATPLDAILPHDFIAARVRKAWRVTIVSFCVALSFELVLSISRVVSWFWGGVP